MLILKVTPETQSASIRAAVRVLRRGGVIAFPTETTYGLGCDPRNAKAVRRIYAIKGREKGKPLLLVASSMAQASRVGDLRDVPSAVTKAHWPGPLTLVVPAKVSAKLAKEIAPKKEVAVRVSSSEIVQALTSSFGFPIVATSANRSGEPDCRSGRAVVRAFEDSPERSPAGSSDTPDLILDLGSLPRRKPSTLARFMKSGQVEVLRQGSVRLSSV